MATETCKTNHFNVKSGDHCPRCGKVIQRDGLGREIDAPELKAPALEHPPLRSLSEAAEDESVRTINTASIEDYIRQTEFHHVQRYILERAVRALISGAEPNRLEALALIRGVTGASLAVAKEILVSAQSSR